MTSNKTRYHITGRNGDRVWERIIEISCGLTVRSIFFLVHFNGSSLGHFRHSSERFLYYTTQQPMSSEHVLALIKYSEPMQEKIEWRSESRKIIIHFTTNKKIT